MRKFSYKNMNSETKNKYSTLKNDLFSQKTESQYVPSYIKEQLQNSIDSKYGKHKYKGLFSQVSDENIEKNITIIVKAQNRFNVIKKVAIILNVINIIVLLITLVLNLF